MGGSCTFVELERHQFPVIAGRSEDLTGKFAHALTQIREWQAYYSSHLNEINTTYGVFGPHGQASPAKFVIIMGRRDDLKNKDISDKYTQLATIFNRVTIMSYDRVLDACPLAETVAEAMRHGASIEQVFIDRRRLGLD